jgi:hypothetical protein
MDSLSVIKDFNPFCNSGSGFNVGLKGLAMHQLSFEGAKEAFCDGIIPTAVPLSGGTPPTGS